MRNAEEAAICRRWWPSTVTSARLAAALGIAMLVGCDASAVSEERSIASTRTALSGGAYWRQVSVLPSSNTRATAYDTRRQKVWLFDVERPRVSEGRMWDWDGTHWTLRAVTNGLPPQVSGPGAYETNPVMVYDSQRDRVVLFSAMDVALTWEWDGTSWTLRERRELSSSWPLQWSDYSMVYDSGRGKTVLVVRSGEHVETWEWDGTSWQPPVSTGAVPQDVGATAYDPVRGKTVLFSAGNTWEWDGTSWTQRTPASAPPTLRPSAMAYDSGRHIVVLCGTQEGSVPLSSTWEWDGENWAERMSAVSPPVHRSVAMAYDNARGKTLLFGSDASGSYDTWEWDGVNWTPRVRAPSARAWHAMAYDEARGEVVLFGGDSGTADTWTWSGTIWQRHFPEGSTPPPRGQMVYDSARERIVLYDGAGGTWEWDGVVWEQRPAIGPAPQLPFVMAYDKARQTVVLFGAAYDPARTETWVWDGTGWTQLAPPNSPPLGRYDAMVYDSARGKVVLIDPTYMDGGTWEWNGSDWRQVSPALMTEWGFGGVAMAYDIARAKVVLSGGGRFNAGTWEWDGTAWAGYWDYGDPSARKAAAMAYDSRRRVTVLFGGYEYLTDGRLAETWEMALEGMPCASSADCESASCVDGVCCAITEPSCGTCHACNVRGSVGVCAPRTGSCDDGNACTQVDTCEAGVCVGSQSVVCAPQSPCHLAGSCDPETGACTNPLAPGGTPCAESSCPTLPPSGSPCFVCVDGACQNNPCAGLTCEASDQCHEPGICEPATGVCSNPARADGSPCDDGDACTLADSCQAGACVGGSPVCSDAGEIDAGDSGGSHGGHRHWRGHRYPERFDCSASGTVADSGYLIAALLGLWVRKRRRTKGHDAGAKTSERHLRQ